MEIKLQKRVTKYWLPSISVFALLGAIALVSINLSNVPEVRTVLVAADNLPEGKALEPGDLVEIKLSLGSHAAPYLKRFETGLVLLKSVAKGELLSRLNLTKASDLRIPVRLNGLRPISKVIEIGDRVDIWATQQGSLSQSIPEPVAFDAIVTLIEADSSMAQNSTNLEIRISEDYLETLLTATDSNYQLSVILNETLADIE
ncbi:MAG: hypothetical protein RL166_672 [Actinomycetota bacterium]|jgi:hypothetical protein